MNLNDVKQNIRTFFGTDPMRPFILIWGSIFAGIAIIALVICIMLESKTGAIRREASGYQAQAQALSQMNVTPGNMQEVMSGIRAQAEADAIRYIPASDVPTVIQNMSEAASANGVILKKVNSLAVKEVEGFPVRSIPVLLQVEGEYSDVGNFLSAVKKSTKWFFIVEEARMSGDIKRTGRITADLKLTFYSRI